jgi:drug/metabolite transporter (DMT)-like permease
MGTLFSEISNQYELMSNFKVILAIIWTGVVTTALTAYGENFAMKSLTASEATVIYSTEPLWGTAFVALALGETVGPNTAVGAAMIMSACILSSVGPPGDKPQGE